MENWSMAIVGVVVFLLLIVSLGLSSTWITILLLLGIIFYALFANPMKEVHETLETRPRKKPHRFATKTKST